MKANYLQNFSDRKINGSSHTALLFSICLSAIASMLLATNPSFAQSSLSDSKSLQVPAAAKFTDKVSDDVKKVLNYYDKQIYFTENKGQWSPDILYKAQFSLGNAIATKDGMLMRTFNSEDISARYQQGVRQEAAKNANLAFNEQPVPLRSHAWLMKFVNSSPDMNIAPKDRHSDNFNYFLGNVSATDVANYQEVWYDNVYDNVDVRYYPSSTGDLEYDIVCKPGFNKSAINMQLDGINQLQLGKNGSLVVKTSVGTMTLPAPVAYQKINGKKVPVTASYIVNGNNTLSFALGNYNPSQPLVIDPIALRWATWISTASTGDNHGHCIWVDPADGAIYVVTRPDGSTDQITPGALETSANGGIDLVIAKFLEPSTVGSAGTRVWQTYVGGSSDDNPYAMEEGADGNLYITGYTNSSDFPLTGGAGFGGSASIDKRGQTTSNIFVMKINQAGNALKAAVIGGNHDDNSYDLRLTSAGDIIVCGNTKSTTLLTQFPGSGATNANGGGFDALIFKINSDLSSIFWMKNYGGAGDDVATIMLTNKTTGDIYVGGYTYSSGFPVTSGAHAARQGTLVGTEDGFIQKLNAVGTTIWSSYFNGTAGDSTSILCMEFNTAQNKIYFGGLTGGLPATNLSSGGLDFQNTFGGGSQDFFCAEIDTAQGFIAGTYVGGSSYEKNLMGLNVDGNNDIYMFGYTASTNFPVTSDALQSTNKGKNDKVFFKLKSDLKSELFGTYFGGVSDDYDPVGERGIKFNNCRIYTIVTAQSNDIPLTQGALNTTKGSVSGHTTTSFYEPGLVVWANPPDLTNNTLTGNQSICAGQTPGNLTGSVPSYSLPTITRNGTTSTYPVVFSPTVTYEWDKSTDSSTWTAIVGGTNQNLSGALLGPIFQKTYIRRIVNGDACVPAGIANQIITIKAFSVTANVNNGCHDQNNGSITLTISTGTAPYTYSWDNSTTGISRSGLAPGGYSVTVTDHSGCTATGTFTIVNPSQLNAFATPTATTCNLPDGNASGSASGGVSPYTYVWSNGSTNPNIFNLAANTYNLTVTDADGCHANASAIVAASLPAQINVNDGVNCSSAGAVLTATGGISYDWSPSTNLNQTTGASVTATPSSSKTYTVTGTDVNGCTGTATSVVTVGTNPTLSASDVSTCAGVGIGISVSCSGTGNRCTGITYTWNPAAGLSSSTGAGVTATPAATTTYTATGTNSAGCSATKTVKVTVNPAPSVSATGGSYCTGGSLGITATGGTTYTWSPATGLNHTTGATVTANPTATTTYTVTGTTSGCSATDTAIVTVKAKPTVVSTGGSYCTGGSFNLTVTGASTYTWSPATNLSATTGASITASPTATTTYTVVGTSAQGCTANDTAKVTPLIKPTVSATGGSYCGTGSVNITASGTATSFTWSPVTGLNHTTGATVTANPTATTTYTVTGSNAAGCTATDTAIVTVKPLPTVSATGGSYCGTGSVDITATGTSTSFTWSPATGLNHTTGASVTANPTATTTYTVTGSNASGCTATDTAIVTVKPLPTVSATGGSYCGTGSVNITATGTSTSFTWSPATGLNQTTGASVTANPTATTTYTVTGSNAAGCSATDTAVVTVKPQPTVSATGGSYCGIGSVNITATGTATSFTWSPASGLNHTTGASVTASPIASTTYTVTGSNASGCTATDTAIVTVNTVPGVSATGGSYCGTGTVSITATGAITYAWAPATGLDVTTGASVSASPASTTTYTVTGTTASGCLGTDTAIVTVNPVPSVSITGPQKICSYSTALLTAQIGAGSGTITGYQWQVGLSNIGGATNNTYTATSTGSYTVIVTNSNGCTGISAPFVVTKLDPISVPGNVTDANCKSDKNGAIDITAAGGDGGFVYSWSNGATIEDLSGIGAGTYNVTVTDANNCTGTNSFTVHEPDTLSITPRTTDITCYKGTDGAIAISVSGGTKNYTYSWDNGATGFNITGLTAGTYTVTVTDAHGCSITRSIELTQPDPINISGTVKDALCNGALNGEIDITITGGTPSDATNLGSGDHFALYTINWSNGATTQDITGLAFGTYIITVTDSHGCSAVDTFSVNQPDSLKIFGTPTDATCYGALNGAVDISVSGGTPDYTYSWTTGAITSGISGVGAGDYTVTVTDKNGCVSTKTFTVNQPDSLSVEILPFDVTCYNACNGGTLVFASGGTPDPNAEGGYTLVWDNPAATGYFSLDLCAGTYHYTITDLNGCSKSDSVVIAQPDSLTITKSHDDVTCFNACNGDATVGVSGGIPGYFIQWNSASISNDNFDNYTPTSLCAGTYQFTVFDNNGCSKSDSIVIIQPDSIHITIDETDSALCYGLKDGSVKFTLSGGSGDFKVDILQNGFNAGGGTVPAGTWAVGGLQAGQWTLVATDAHGCVDSVHFNIDQPDTIHIVAEADSVPCYGGTGSVKFTLSGGSGSYKVDIIHSGDNFNAGGGTVPAGTWSVGGLKPGHWTLVVTDAHLCSNSSEFDIYQPDSITASATKNDVTCHSACNGSVTVTATGGTGTLNITWDNASASGFTPSGLCSGVYNYTITDFHKCLAFGSVTISQPDTLVVTDTTIVNAGCNGDKSGSISITVNGGVKDYTYSWDNNGTDAAITGLGSGDYTVTVTDANGCSLVQTYNVGQPSTLDFTITTYKVKCHGGNDGSVKVTATGGSPDYTYSWSSNAATTDSIGGLVAGDYSVTVTDAHGCAVSKQFTINQPDTIIITGTTHDVNCYGESNGSATVIVTGGSTDFVSFPGTLSYAGLTGQTFPQLSGGVLTGSPDDIGNCCRPGTSSGPTNVLPFTVSVSGVYSITNNYSGWDGYLLLYTNPLDFTQNPPVTFITGNDDCSNSASSCVNAALVAGQNYYLVTTTFAGTSNGSFTTSFSGPGQVGHKDYTYQWSNGSNLPTAAGLTAGTYTLTVTDSHGCVATGSYIINQPDTLTVDGKVTDVNCHSEKNGAVNITAAGGTKDYSYIWNNGATTEDLSGVGAGTYNVTVTDNHGCVATGSFTVNQPDTLTVNGKVTDVTCHGDKNGAVNITVAGGTKDYSYAWDNGTTTEDLSGVGAGTYNVTVTDNHGCVATGSFTVNQPDTIIITGTTHDVNCYGESNGSATVIVTGGSTDFVSFPGTLSYAGLTGQTFPQLSGGVLTGSPDDIGNCCRPGTSTGPTNIETFTVNISGVYAITNNYSGWDGYMLLYGNPLDFTQNPPTTFINGNDDCSNSASSCINVALTAGQTYYLVTTTFAGTSNGSFTTSFSGPGQVGHKGYTYQWSNGSNLPTAAGLTAGTYTLTVTDNHGCVATGSYIINQPDTLKITDASVTNANCNGDKNGAIDITVAGGTTDYTYSWDNGVATANNDGIGAGTYNVTVTDAHGCVATGTYQVTEPAPLAITDTVIINAGCNGDKSGSITITVSGGTKDYTYSWDNNGTDAAITGLASGGYTVTVTDAHGCSLVQTYNVGQPSTLDFTIATNDVKCYGGNDGTVKVTATGGSPDYTYSWSSSAATTDSIGGLVAGDYSVTVTDAHGCAVSKQFTINQPDSLSVSVLPFDVTCYNACNGGILVFASGGTPDPLADGGYTLVWDNPAATGYFSLDLCAGTYHYTITDLNGCSKSDSVVITQPDSLIITKSHDDVTCFNACNGDATVGVSGGVAGYLIEWDNASISNDNFDNFTPAALCAGTYHFTVFDGNFCSKSDSIVVTQPDSLHVTADQTNVTCHSACNGSITVNVIGGTVSSPVGGAGAGKVSYFIVWDNADVTGFTPADLCAGTYCYTVTDLNQCAKTGCVTITEPDTLTVTLDKNASCLLLDNCQAFVNATATGGVAPYTYAWSGPSGFTATGSDTIKNLCNAGIYKVTVTDKNGCQAIANIGITCQTCPPGSVTIDGPKTTCVASLPVTLTATTIQTPIAYAWSNGSTNASIQVSTGGIYTVTVTFGDCQSSASDTLDIKPQPHVTPDHSDVACHGACNGTITLTVTNVPSHTTSWSGPNSFTGSGDALENLCGGTYNYTVDADGCIVNGSVTINETPSSITATPVTVNTLCYNTCNGSISLSIKGGTQPYSIIWEGSSATTDTLKGLCTGTYNFTVYDVNKCSATGSSTVSQPDPPTAGPDTTICFGDSVQLLASGGGIYSWSPATGLNSASVFNPVASPTVTTTYTVTVSNPTGNLVFNGDFEKGDTAFTTDYKFVPNQLPPPYVQTPSNKGLWPEGTYTVDSNSHLYHALFNGHAHGTGNDIGHGKFLIVNGSTIPGQVVWEQNVTNVIPNTLYYFTAQISTQHEKSPALLNFTIDGTLINPTLVAPLDTNHWIQFYATWNSGANTIATIQIVNNNTIASGNDFGLDDIMFTTVCSNTADVVVTVDHIKTSVTKVDPKCNGGNDGQASVTAADGILPYTFHWSNGATDAIATGLSKGKYYVTVADAHGCSVRDSITLGQPDKIVSHITSTNPTNCNPNNCNGTATVAPTGGTGAYTISWSNTQSGTNATGLCAGKYYVTITDEHNCSIIDSVKLLTINCECPVVTVTHIDAKCFSATNGSISLHIPNVASAVYTVAWSKANSNLPTDTTLKALGAGTYCYTVTFTDINCTRTGCVDIGQNPEIIAIVNCTTACYNQCNAMAYVTASGGTAPYTYSWSNVGGTFTAGNVDTIKNLCPGTYFVTVTDSKGCVKISGATVFGNSQIVIGGTVHNVTCYGLCNGSVNATVTGGTPPYFYNWSTGNTTDLNISSLCPGKYFLTVTDHKNCTAVDSFTITQPDTLHITATKVDGGCFGSCIGTINVSVSGGTPSYTISWNHQGVTGFNPKGLCKGTYCYTVTDANGCSGKSGCLNIISNDTLAVATTHTDLTCNELNGPCDGTIHVSVSKGTAPYTITWSDNLFGATGAVMTDLCPDTYCYTVTDANGCTKTGCVTIGEPKPLLIASNCCPDEILCHNDCSGKINITVFGGVPPFTYSWNGPNGYVSSDSDIFHLCPGMYTVTVTDKNGCTYDHTHAPLINPDAIISHIAGKNPTNCKPGSCNGSASVAPTGGTAPYSIVWSTGSTATSITGLCAVTYKVTITDHLGCSVVDSVKLLTTECECPVVTASKQDLTCYGVCNGSVTLHIAGGAAASAYTVNWSVPNSNINTDTVLNGLCANTYCYTVTFTELSCSKTGCITVGQADSLHVTATHTDLTCNEINGPCDGTITVSVEGGTAPYSIRWSENLFGATGAVQTDLCPDTYCFMVTDANGCTKMGCVTIVEPPMLLISSNCCPDQITCHNACNGKIDITVFGGVAPFTYSWNGPNGYTSSDSDIFHLCPGVYTVTVTDKNGCTYDHTHAPLINPDSIISNISGTVNTNCNPGQCNGTATVAPTGGTSPYEVVWSTGGTGNTITGLCAGKYFVTITDSYGCQDIDSVRIFAPACTCPTVTAEHTNPACYGSATGTITIHISKPAPAGTVIKIYHNGIPTVATDTTITGLVAGNYCYVVTSTVNPDCKDSACLTITQPDSLHVTASHTNLAPCSLTCNGTITVSVSGGTPSYSISWANSASHSFTRGDLCIGTYCYTVTDANGCIRTGCQTITQPTGTLSSSHTQSNVTCHGSCNGTATVTPSGGTPSYTISWNKQGVSGLTPTGLCAGTYCYTVNDATGCSTSDCITITEPNELIASSTHTDGTCNSSCNGTITVTVSGGTPSYTISWNKQGVSGLTPTGLCAGTYCYTVTDAHGCSKNGCQTVTQTSLSVHVTKNNLDCASTCAGGSCNGTIGLTITGSNNYTVKWSGPNGFISYSANLTKLCAGTYCYTVCSGTCTLSDCVTLTQPKPLSISVNSTNSACSGKCDGTASVTVSSGDAPYTYYWTGGAKTSSISGLCAGTYCVTVTSAAGCTATKCVCITSGTPLSLSVCNTNVTCNGNCNGTASVTVSGGTKPYTYNWSNGKTTASVSGLCASTYCVTVTSAGGCSSAKCVTITQPAPVSINVTSTNISCNGSCNGTAGVTVTGGTGPFSYHWSNGACTANVYGLCAGNYCVTVTSCTGCSASKCITISQPAPVCVTVTTSNASCNGSCNGSASVKATGGNGSYTYKWSNGATTSSVSGLCGGSYSVIVYSGNCSVTSCFSISQPGAINLSITKKDITCNGSCNGTATVTVSGGTAPYTYKWSSGATTSGITGLCANTYCVTVTAKGGCSASKCITVSQPAAVAATVTSSNITCNGSCNGSASVAVTGGIAPFTYHWSNGASSSSVHGLCGGCYYVTITSCGGCSIVKTVTISQPAPLSITVTTGNISCNGSCNGTATASVTGGTAPYTYKWTNGQTTAKATGLCAGSYTVTVTSAGGCCITKCITISQPAAICASVITSAPTCSKPCSGSAIVYVTGGTGPFSYHWSNGATTASISNLCASTYYVTISGAGGCSIIKTAVISSCNCGGNSRTDADDASVIVTPAEGIEITAFPNPFSTQATIEFVASEDMNGVLEVYNITGEKVAQLYKGEMLAGKKYSFSLDAANLASGMYIGRLTTDKQVKTVNIIKVVR